MTKFWRVVAYEYTRQITRKGFWFGLLSMPALILFMIGLVLITINLQTNATPIGYVDHSGLLADPVPAPAPEPPDKPVPMLAFADEAAARKALDEGKIQAYYVVSASYMENSEALLVYNKQPKALAQNQFQDFMIANLLKKVDKQVANRLVAGSNITSRTVDGSRQVGPNDWFAIFVPIFGALVFFIAIFSSTGYIMQAVVEEKENRTMEIIVTSISPNQLMVGKIIGVICVGLTQLLAWILFLILGIGVGTQIYPPLRSFRIGPDMLVTMVAVLLPCFVMLAGLMAAVGATVTEAREGQQIAGLFTLPLWIPYFLIQTLLENSNSPLAVGLTLFPFTSPMTILLRIGFTVIPTWQIVTAVALLVLCAIGSLWLAGRTFRLGMLMYGKKLSLREVFARR